MKTISWLACLMCIARAAAAAPHITDQERNRAVATAVDAAVTAAVIARAPVDVKVTYLALRKARNLALDTSENAIESLTHLVEMELHEIDHDAAQLRALIARGIDPRIDPAGRAILARMDMRCRSLDDGWSFYRKAIWSLPGLYGAALAYAGDRVFHVGDTVKGTFGQVAVDATVRRWTNDATRTMLDRAAKLLGESYDPHVLTRDEARTVVAYGARPRAELMEGARPRAELNQGARPRENDRDRARTADRYEVSVSQATAQQPAAHRFPCTVMFNGGEYSTGSEIAYSEADLAVIRRMCSEYSGWCQERCDGVAGEAGHNVRGPWDPSHE